MAHSDPGYPKRIDKDTVPQWVYEEYQGDVEDFSDWLFGVIYWAMWGDRPEALKTADNRSRAWVLAAEKTLERTKEIEGLADRSAVFQMYRLQENGNLHLLEYGDIRDMLKDKMSERDPDDHIIYDDLFVIEILFPALEKVGVPPQKLLGIPMQYSKMRRAVPTLRKMLEGDTDVEKITDALIDVINDVVNPKVSVREMVDKMKGKIFEKAAPLAPATIYQMPGYEMIVVSCSDPIQRRAVEMAIKHVVEWSGPQDPLTLLSTLAKLLMKSSPIIGADTFGHGGYDDSSYMDRQNAVQAI